MIDDNDILDAETSPGTALAAVSGGPVTQRIQTEYTTAMMVQRPRTLNVVQKRLMEEARLLGETAYYGWGAGKDRIEGPSQALAYSAARCWGNCAVDQPPVESTPTEWIFTSIFVDCETGFTLGRKFRQSKNSTVYGKMDTERKNDMRFGTGQSKCDRNVILKALPKWLIDQAMDEAKAGVRAKLESYIAKHGLPAAIDYATKELAKSGIKEPQICEKFSVAKKSALSVDNLVVMAGDIKAIQSGQEYPAALYPSTDAADIANQLTRPRAESPQDAMQPIAARNESSTAPENADEAVTVAHWREEVGTLKTMGELAEAKRTIPQTLSQAGQQSILSAVEMAEAAIRGQRQKRVQKTLMDGTSSATEAGE